MNTIQLYLAVVVMAVFPLAHQQVNKASAAPSTPEAKSVRLGASSYAVASEACKKLVTEKKFAEAKESCTSAVAFAGKLPAKEWRQRSAAYSARGQAELGANDADDAAQDFQQVIEIDGKNLKPTDAALAVDYANLGLAQFQLGGVENLNASDANFQKASDALELDGFNDPSNKNEYQRTLKGILLNYAKVKRARGEENMARALEQQANTIQERLTY